jgi:PAS domain S-box-containing protein
MVKKTKTKKKQKTESPAQTEKETLRISKEKLSSIADEWQTIFDSINDAVSLIDTQGRIMQCNKAMSEFISKPFPEIIGHKCWELMHGSTKPIPECPIVRMKKSMKRETLTLPLMGRWFEVTTDPIIDKRGKLAGAVHIIVDITERKQAEEKLKASEVRLLQITSTTPTYITEIDKDGIIRFVNRTYEGLTYDQVIGTSLTSWFPESLQGRISEIIKRIFESEKIQSIEYTIPTPQGERTYSSHILPIKRDNRIVSAVHTATDITKRKRVEEAIIREKMLSDSIVNNIPAGIAFLDNDFILRQCNRAYADLIRKYTPYTPEQALGMSYYDYAPGSRPQVEACFQKVRDLTVVDTRYGFKLTLQRDGQEEITFWDTSVAPVLDPAGKVEGILILTQDMTDRKRLEEQVKHFHEMKIFGQLAVGVAHEVRNPLNAILALTEALFQDIGDNPEYLPYLEHIRNQVDRLSILMKDLLEIGKPIYQDSFQPETVAGIFTSTINLWGIIDISKRHTLRFISHPESEKLFVKTDIARLQQVVLNLLQNASQNSSEGSEIVIQVFEPKDKTVNVHIIDRGTGIPPDNLKHVFEPFFTTRKGGTGLGLSLVKNFVGSMNGKVAIWNNDPPPGCTVELSLPIATDSES